MRDLALLPGLYFLSPAGLLVALVVAAPLLGLALVRRRAGRVERAVGLPPSGGRRAAEVGAALAAVALLLGLAAAQPVLAISHSRPARSDAEVLFVLDVSGSMQAAAGPGQPTRLDRAKTFARRLRAALGDVPAGIASLTDRTLPHLFPTANGTVFDATLAQSVQIEQPPSASRPDNPSGRTSTLGALTAVATANFYSRAATHRVLVVLSDDESNPFVEAAVAAVFRKPPQVHTIFVRFGTQQERIWLRDGKPNVFYRPDPTSEQTVETLAAVTHGRAFRENQLGRTIAAARRDVGAGAVREAPIDRTQTPIAAWVALAAIVPLGLVLRRRNL